MDWNELIEKLNGQEWNDVEFKQALEPCPRNAYTTVSAFANTNGDWLVFGVANHLREELRAIPELIAVPEKQPSLVTDQAPQVYLSARKYVDII
jgi:predicted HTH transcriptional regulator